MNIFRKRLLACVALGALASCGGTEAGAADQASGTETAAPANPAQAADFAASGNGSLLTLTGKVVATEPGWFRLDIGPEVITVEMDDWDWYKEGRALLAGDRVTVNGRVDQDLWEQKKLEASSVYVPKLGVSFFASGADEEELAAAAVQVDTDVTARGQVMSIEGREFTIGAVGGPVRVDASQLSNPPHLKVGDRVYAWGDLDLDPREKVELMADGVVILAADMSKKDAS